MGLLGGILDFATDLIPGGGIAKKAAKLGVGVLGSIAGAKRGAKADRLSADQLGLARERWNAGLPFRQRLQQQAFSIPSQREDLSSIFADPGNPYARSVPRPMIQPPTTATPIAQRGPMPGAPPAKRGILQAVVEAEKARRRGGGFI